MSQAPQRVLLTGARGCIGRAFQAYMVREHSEIGVVSLMPFPFSIQRVGDTLLNGGYTHFVNCASMGDDRDSLERPYPYFDTNATGVTKHLEMIRQHSPVTRYLNLGTVYEYDPTRIRPYVVSKRMARQVVQSYRENHGLYAVTATLDFTEYEGRPETCLARRITRGVVGIARAIQRGESFEPLTLRDLDQPYRWTWAEDVADGMWRMLNQEPSPENVAEVTINGCPIPGVTPLVLGWEPQDYTLATSELHTPREFVERAFATAGIVGRWAKDVDNPAPESERYIGAKDAFGYHSLVQLALSHAPQSLTYTQDYTATASAARRDLNWFPKVSFDELVERMVRSDMATVEREQVQKRAA